MGKFILGIITTVVVMVVVGLAVGLMGFADMTADHSPSQIETWFAGGSMDASVERHAPDVKNPIQPTEDNLREGMVVYTMNCAVCHGNPKEPESALGRNEYPPAPQFLRHNADMADNQNFYIIKHGVRLTAMPAWQGVLTDDQMWKVATFLREMDKLPPSLQQLWQPAAASAPAAPAPKDMKDMRH